MAKTKAKEDKEKPLDKMTAKELREAALKLEGIVGVHAMNKNELIAAIKEVKGIVDVKSGKKTADVRGLKVKVRELKEKRVRAKEEGNKRLADSLRRKISNLKKKTRKAG
ncbi:MAG TPA: transcription termination factor Rho [Syntrophobacteraceae bacterium]|nr:transcription termination factor Rho [Syntrophobacteraceae bacterium]